MSVFLISLLLLFFGFVSIKKSGWYNYHDIIMKKKSIIKIMKFLERKLY